MYVCICRGITEKQIRDVVEEETCSMQEVSAVMGIGMDCGTCMEYACQLLAEIKQKDFSVKSCGSSSS